jgi:antitoxin component YwqK of YwqJK toxin-antitoxin module
MKKVLYIVLLLLLICGCEKNGLHTEYYKSGKKKSEINYKDGKKEGLGTWWHESGEKWKETTFSDGKSNGLFTEWSENGQKYKEGNLKDGQQNGLWTTWRDDGQRWEEVNFKNGIKHGLLTEWYKNGKKRGESNFKYGNKDGLEKEWYESGKKKFEGVYGEGEPDGLWTEWSENGEILRKKLYNQQDTKQFEWVGEKLQNSATESIAGDYCYPDCDNPSSALKFNSDGTFNSSTSAFGGMSRWGNWEKVDNDKIKLITTRISTNSNSDKVPPPQTIYIMSNGGLKIGSTIYIKG